MTGLLVIRPRPQPDENIQGFLQRLAEANVLRSPTWIKELPRELESLQLTIGTSLHGQIPSWLKGLIVAPITSSKLNARYLLGPQARCCPECLREAEYWRTVWEFVFYTVCHRHKKQMVDQCPVCHRRLQWRRSKLMRCNCGSILKDWDSIDVPENERQLPGLLVRCIGRGDGANDVSESTLITQIEKMNGDELSRLILIFGLYCRTGSNGGHKYQHRYLKVADAHHLVCHASHILRDWPINFYAYLRAASGYNREKVEQQDPAPEFIKFVKALRKNFKSSKFDFILSVYRSFIVENWPRMLTRRQRWPEGSVIQDQRFVIAEVAAAMFKIPRHRILELLNQNILRGYIRYMPSGRRYIYIERSSLVGAQERLGDQITLRGVTELLGLSRTRIEELIAGRFLRTFIDSTCKTPHEFLSRTEINRFLKQLSVAEREPCLGEELVTGAMILKTHLASNSEFSALTAAVISGALPTVTAASPYSGIAGLSFARAEFYAWRSEYREASKKTYLTVVEVAALMEVKQEVAYHLTRIGILKTTIHRVGKRDCVLVEKREVERFIEIYVSAADLAEKVVTSPRALIKKLNEFEIQPVIGPEIDLCRQYFYLRADLLQLQKQGQILENRHEAKKLPEH